MDAATGGNVDAKLASDSSVVLNLSDAWRRDELTLSLYQER